MIENRRKIPLRPRKGIAYFRIHQAVRKPTIKPVIAHAQQVFEVRIQEIRMAGGARPLGYFTLQMIYIRRSGQIPGKHVVVGNIQVVFDPLKNTYQPVIDPAVFEGIQEKPLRFLRGECLEHRLSQATAGYLPVSRLVSAKGNDLFY